MNLARTYTDHGLPAPGLHRRTWRRASCGADCPSSDGSAKKGYWTHFLGFLLTLLYIPLRADLG